MWPACRDRGIAAITYQAIFDTDLTRLSKWELDEEVKGAARSSIWRFAWEIRGGDEILVGDSVSKCFIARGFVSSLPGERAYRFNPRTPIREPGNPDIAWRHEVPVDWDGDFHGFRYRDGAPQHTVMHFDPAWAAEEIEPSDFVTSADNTERKPLNEEAYTRETRASLGNVERLHTALSNRFRSWLRSRLGVTALQERASVDVTFKHAGKTHLAELKICYGGNTRAAIRDALGQLLEYNHYPPRSEAESWWLVLDNDPLRADRDYINVLRSKYTLPLTLAWPAEAEFRTHPEWPAPQ
jgi:hypothetical protein